MINIVYITSNVISIYHKGHSAFVNSNGSTITVAINFYGAELNTFLKVDSDIYSTTVSAGNVSTATREQLIIAKGLSDLISRHINYSEMMGSIAPQNRGSYLPPSSYQDIFAHIQASLYKDRMEEHPKAYNYNLRTGRIKRWY